MSFCRKIFTYVILSVTFFNTFAYSEVVNKVEAEGNERISLETIMIFGDVSIGKNYENSDYIRDRLKDFGINVNDKK